MKNKKKRDGLLNQDFVNGWLGDPRSLQYREGFQAGYTSTVKGEQSRPHSKMPIQYKPGTVELDAWLAGWEHGRERAELDLMRIDDEDPCSFPQ